jgi:predicted hydrocarbon binding protein
VSSHSPHPFPSDFAQGSLRNLQEERVVAVSVDLIETLHATLGQQFGEAAPDLLYRSGYECSLQDMSVLSQKLTVEMSGSNLDLWQMDAKYILQKWWEPLAEAGWGCATFDVSALARGRVIVDVIGSPMARVFTGGRAPVCHFHAGMYAGAVSFFERNERHATELQCCANGHGSCRFLVTTGAEIDSAETWRKQGTSALDIARRLG